MNDKFYDLPLERQNQIINGALKVFSESTYKQASTIEIASEAGISKGLLFHYFKNKKELYLFLYKRCIELSMGELEKSKSAEETDFFQILLNSQHAKCKLMKEHRFLYDFLVKVYLETDPEIVEGIVQYSKPIVEDNSRHFFEKIDVDRFKEDVDIQLLMQSLQWCSDGFMRSAFSKNASVDEINEEFAKVLELYRRNFYKTIEK